MTGPLRQAPRSRRAAALAILAVTDIIYGAALIAGYMPLSLAGDIAPSTTWGIIWITAAVIIALGAFTATDQISFAAATLVKFGWAALIIGDLAQHGTHGGWGPAVPWLALAGLLLVIAGWQDGHH